MAAALNHTKAMEMVAMGYIFGTYLKQNVTRAREMLDTLSMSGSPRGQMVGIDDFCFQVDDMI